MARKRRKRRTLSGRTTRKRRNRTNCGGKKRRKRGNSRCFKMRVRRHSLTSRKARKNCLRTVLRRRAYTMTAMTMKRESDSSYPRRGLWGSEASMKRST